ncbi:hypothetical protein RJ640_006229 [Escallonia rubra]|uniref:BED-type domain-containing protein n=1 Tax=Escallonia rubra TaxID=112253 RepID=A0AA88QSK3_9ASTE|nr:hypothetical protein RJ640_006229 [Escallonia rubra]
MTDNSSSIASAPARSDDPAWAHGKVVEGKRNNTICIHCDKHLKGGGITRLKMHLAGVTGQVEACKKAPHDVRWQMKQLLEGYQKAKARKEKLNVNIGYGDCIDVDDDSEDIALSADSVGNAGKKKGKEVAVASKRKKVSSFFAPRTTPGSQPSIKSAMATKEMVENAKLAVARWWYDANVPFNGAHSKYYQPMFDAALAVGPGFKAPSFHDLRGNLLRTFVDEISTYLDEFRPIWELYGCYVMSDGWSNRRQEPVINFLVYCPKGTMFLKSIDASSLTKDADTLYGIFNEVVQLIGPNYIPSFKKQKEVTRGLLSTITALVPDDYMQDLISSQLEEYKQAIGDFGMPIAVRQREKLNPDLQKFAIRVLSQCTSATGYERNWSVFEFIHSKKRNRLEHKRLNDLVFVRYSLKLRERAIGRTKEALDPVSLDNIDVLADWVSEEESVITQEDLDNDGGWDVLQPEPAAVNLEDEEVHYEDEEDALHDIPSQYDWEFGGEGDPYHNIE